MEMVPERPVGPMAFAAWSVTACISDRRAWASVTYIPV